MDILDFELCFDVIDATPSGYPGSYCFVIPNDRAFERWPNWPAAATPEACRAASGRGLDQVATRNSGLGEAIELASCCAWGDEACEMASLVEMGNCGIAPSTLQGLSVQQMAERAEWNRSLFGKLDWRPAELAPERAIEWMISQDAVSGEGVWLPADHVLIGRRNPGDEAAVAIATTSGCAAGSSPVEAQLRALLEVIERDAIGRWWYGGQAALAMPLDSLPEQLDAFLTRRDRHTSAFVIGNEFGITVVAAVSWPQEGRPVAMGFAARPTRHGALEAAICELFQTEIGIGQRMQQRDPLLDYWSETVHADTGHFVTSSKVPKSRQPDEAEVGSKAKMEQVVAAICATGHRVLFVDHTRPEFGVPVFRAIVPGFCSDKPRWGFARLYPDGEGQDFLRLLGPPANPIPLAI